MFDSTSSLRQCVNIGIVVDTISELDEIFQVSLVQSTSVGVLSQVATVTIFDNAPPPGECGNMYYYVQSISFNQATH